MPESPDFEKVKEQAQEIKVPAMQVFKNHPRELLTIIFARAAENAWFYIASTFALAYTTTKLGIPRQDILFATICGAGLIMVMTPLCGHLSDKVGQRNMFMFGLLVSWSLGLLVSWSLGLGIILLSIFHHVGDQRPSIGLDGDCVRYWCGFPHYVCTTSPAICPSISG